MRRLTKQEINRLVEQAKSLGALDGKQVRWRDGRRTIAMKLGVWTDNDGRKWSMWVNMAHETSAQEYVRLEPFGGGRARYKHDPTQTFQDEHNVLKIKDRQERREMELVGRFFNQ